MDVVISSDRPPVISILSRWLGLRQARITVAETLPELIEAIREPDSIVVFWREDAPGAVEAVRVLRDRHRDNLALVLMPVQAVGAEWSDAASIRSRVLALNAGADDAQTWPVAESELVERCRALQRRQRVDDAPDEIVFAGCVFLPELHQVRRGDITVSLSPTETAYLRALTASPESVVTNARLMREVYGEDHRPVSRSLMKVHVHKLRKKLSPLTDGLDIFESVWGRGTRFIPEGFRPAFDHLGNRRAG